MLTRLLDMIKTNQSCFVQRRIIQAVTISGRLKFLQSPKHKVVRRKYLWLQSLCYVKINCANLESQEYVVAMSYNATAKELKGPFCHVVIIKIYMDNHFLFSGLSQTVAEPRF